MFILDTILIGGLRFVFDKIAASVDTELNDDSHLREQLLAGQMRVELGEMTSEEFETFEADILARRWNADPEDVRRSVAKLVLTLIEFIRQILERQAIRRMEAGTLTEAETEAVGLALMKLEETVRDLSSQFGLALDDLNLDLGPVGKLM